jgi:Tol biopolymer transport system component
MPDVLIGKIAFKSNRTNEEKIYVINPDGSGLALLNGCGWPYYLAEQADAYSIDGRFRVFTKDTIRYGKVTAADGTEYPVRENPPALYWYDAFYKVEEQLSQFGAGIAYGGVWSPTKEQIAFISTESQNDEIWVVNRDGSGLLQLTRDEYAWWDKHPSWSPDGQQIVFWSNRTGHGQIFVMNADGSNLYSLSRTGFDDYDPVWIKYKGIPTFNPDSENGEPTYIGSFGYCASAGDMNCAAFKTQAEAQSLFNFSGGPLSDPYGLDSDRDGKACESLP